MPESVYKIVELVGASPDSWEKAASAALTRAKSSIRNLRIAEVSALDVHLDDEGNIIAYRAKLKVSFKMDD